MDERRLQNVAVNVNEDHTENAEESLAASLTKVKISNKPSLQLQERGPENGIAIRQQDGGQSSKYMRCSPQAADHASILATHKLTEIPGAEFGNGDQTLLEYQNIVPTDIAATSNMLNYPSTSPQYQKVGPVSSCCFPCGSVAENFTSNSYVPNRCMSQAVDFYSQTFSTFPTGDLVVAGQSTTSRCDSFLPPTVAAQPISTPRSSLVPDELPELAVEDVEKILAPAKSGVVSSDILVSQRHGHTGVVRNSHVTETAQDFLSVWQQPPVTDKWRPDIIRLTQSSGFDASATSNRIIANECHHAGRSISEMWSPNALQQQQNCNALSSTLVFIQHPDDSPPSHEQVVVGSPASCRSYRTSSQVSPSASELYESSVSSCGQPPSVATAYSDCDIAGNALINSGRSSCDSYGEGSPALTADVRRSSSRDLSPSGYHSVFFSPISTNQLHSEDQFVRDINEDDSVSVNSMSSNGVVSSLCGECLKFTHTFLFLAGRT